MSDPVNHLISIWYHSELSDVPYSPNQFLGWDFFCSFLQQDGSKADNVYIFWYNFEFHKLFINQKCQETLRNIEIPTYKSCLIEWKLQQNWYLDCISIPNGCKHFYFYNYFIGMKQTLISHWKIKNLWNWEISFTFSWYLKISLFTFTS